MLFLGGRREALLEPVAPELEPFDCEVSGVVDVGSMAVGEGVSSIPDRASADMSSRSAESLNMDASVFMIAKIFAQCLYLFSKANGMPQGPA